MKIKKKQIITIAKAANRELELAVGRINYKRVHKSKKAYNRQKHKRVTADCFS